MSTNPPPAPASEASYWNSAATRAWSERHALIDRLFAGLTQFAIDRAAPTPGEIVLDVGCGSGATVLELAPRVAPAGRVVGVDVAEMSAARANARIAEAGLSNAEVIVADAARHDFAPLRFDLVFSRFGVMFFADPVAAFSAIRAQMKPGGRLALAVFRGPRENPWATEPLNAVRGLLPPIAPVAPDAPGQFAFADPARVEGILAGAGFSAIRLEPHDPAMRMGTVDEALEFGTNVGPIVRATLQASEAKRSEVRAALADFYRGHSGDDGVVLKGGIWIVHAKA
jgi:SAM-dependent methyltransferase